MTITKALLSVSDKTNVVALAQGLYRLDIAIVSSGGTAKTLRENSIPCREIAEVTGFPEILDGRVKTLNPKIHGGILARRDRTTHLDELRHHGIDPIDIVVVNLYPFETTIAGAKPGEINDEIIENIDIGGVALLRAAAKNFNDVLVVCDPADYAALVGALEKKAVTPELRQTLAAKAFAYTAYYDALIAGCLSKEKFPAQLTIPLRKTAPLRYGENPHQAAAVYRWGGETGGGVVAARQLQGKELSYNNYLDLDSAWKLVSEFSGPACAIIKHNNPCGCAEANDLGDAYRRALASDPVSAFGGIVAVNREMDEATAAEIAKIFTECIIAPGFDEKARQVFAAKRNLRLLEMPASSAASAAPPVPEYRDIAGGMLVQDRDASLLDETRPVTARPPTDGESASLLFAWKVCKHVKSNAIVLVRGRQTVGVGAGQMSRIDSLRIASAKMKEVRYPFDGAKQPLVLASDAFFPFPDVVNESATIGVSAIAQPGGSVKDQDSVKAADGHGIAMIFTGMRHFRH